MQREREERMRRAQEIENEKKKMVRSLCLIFVLHTGVSDRQVCLLAVISTRTHRHTNLYDKTQKHTHFD